MARFLKAGVIVAVMFVLGAGVALAGTQIQQRDQDRTSTPDSARLGDGAGEKKQVRATTQDAQATTVAVLEDVQAVEPPATDETLAGETDGDDANADDESVCDYAKTRARVCAECAERVGEEDCDADRTRTQARERDQDGDCDGDCDNEEPLQTQTRTQTRAQDCDGDGDGVKTQKRTQAGKQTQSQTTTQATSQTETQSSGDAGCDGSGPQGGGQQGNGHQGNGQGDCDGSGQGGGN